MPALDKTIRTRWPHLIFSVELDCSPLEGPITADSLAYRHMYELAILLSS